ncbi:hypothetical protein N7533_003470 [Penicillium manginii]|uniref:uncharacterized protein n=1 Tax=Penicillium manginii TaxID=203109 RepID=UPI002549BA72|nr:uncharacterized protein N7533_003470 [Penicillium manginii]KAJ5761431.1 hypothetical protein N7533_003470 [Penicillium manginii]
MAATSALMATAISNLCLTIAASFAAQVNTDGAMAFGKKILETIIPGYFFMTCVILAISSWIASMTTSKITIIMSFFVNLIIIAILVILTTVSLATLLAIMMAVIDALFMSKDLAKPAPLSVIMNTLIILFITVTMEALNTSLFTSLLADVSVVAIQVTLATLVFAVIFGTMKAISGIVTMSRYESTLLVIAASLNILGITIVSARVPIPARGLIKTIALSLTITIRISRTASGGTDTKRSLRLLK